MAIISTFELLLKRIGAPNLEIAPNRKLLQGYYLTIANPNDRSINLVMRAVVPKRKDNTFTAAQRELVGGNTGNHVYAYDRTGCSANAAAAPRELLGPMFAYTDTPSSLSFQTRSANLQPFQTGLFNLIPKPNLVILDKPQLEIRGYIEILQLVVYRFNRGRLEVITPKPVDLIFTPEIRGTFIDDDFNGLPSSEEFDFDQSNYALPTSTGAARINISEVYNPLLLPGNPVPDVPPAGITGVLGALDPGKLTGRKNFLGEYVLDDKALKYIAETMNKKNIKDMKVKDAKVQVETLINQLLVKEE